MVDRAVEAAAQCLLDWAGLVVPQHRYPLLQDALLQLGSDLGEERLLSRLRRGDRALGAQLFRAASIHETYLFRHAVQFDALRGLAESHRQTGRDCHVLSAGCSTGEEVWSAAAVLASVYGTSGGWTVTGWDLEAACLRRAQVGSYPSWSARSGFHGYDALFTRTGRDWVVQQSLHSGVRWQQVNLSQPDLPAGLFDAILFRNVCIYLSREHASSVTARLCRQLGPDGLLMLGPCDPVSLDGRVWLPHGPMDRRVYYRAVSPPRAERVPLSAPIGEKSSAGGASAAPSRTARRNRAAPTCTHLTPRIAAAERPTPVLDSVRELADTGKCAEALAFLEQADPEPSTEVLLWKGILLLTLDDPEQASRAFQQCVFLEPEAPEQRRWLAVAQLRLGRREDAERENRNARELEECT